jgi:signal transduction histidine kinase
MYRFIFALTVVLWFVLTFLLSSILEPLGIPLINIRFNSLLGIIWLMCGVGLLLLGVLNLLRARSNSSQWITRFKSLSGYLNEGVVVCDARGKVRWHNETAQDLLDNASLNPTLRALLKRAETSRRIAMQTLPLKDGARYTVQAFPLDRRTYALISRPMQTGGQQNNFYENFIRRIVHDMRNPLAAIIGHSANMRQSPTVEPDNWRKSIGTIEDEAQRLARLVDSMLFDARLAYVPLEPQQLDLADVLEEALFAQDERAAREGKTLEMDAPPGPMKMEGDRDLLVRAFENLIDNSLKYSGPDGRLHISLEAQPNAHVIQFADNGEGIPPEYLPDRIFEPLVRARSHGSGSGLGLSTVRKIIDMHGGSITAHSRVGAGTTMTVRLPKPDEGGTK